MKTLKELQNADLEQYPKVWTSLHSDEPDRLLIRGVTKSLVATSRGWLLDLLFFDNDDIYDSKEALVAGEKAKLYKQGELIGYYCTRKGTFGIAVVLQDRDRHFSVDVLIGDEITTLMREETFRLGEDYELK